MKEKLPLESQTSKILKDKDKMFKRTHTCGGLSLENFQDIKQGDVVEPYILEEIQA